MKKIIEYKPHILRRLFAGIIDYSIFFTICMSISFVLTILLNKETHYLDLVIMSLVWFLYIVIIEYKFNATIGNKITGLIPRSLVDNKKPTLTQSFLRHLLDLIDLFFIGIVTIIIIINSEKKQRLGDMLAKTYVIKREENNV